MDKLVPNIMEMGTFLCMQITDKLFKFLNNSFGSKAVLSLSEEVYYYDDYLYYNELVKQVITKLMLLLTY